jgi:hypothetical protein
LAVSAPGELAGGAVVGFADDAHAVTNNSAKYRIGEMKDGEQLPGTGDRNCTIAVAGRQYK